MKPYMRADNPRLYQLAHDLMHGKEDKEPDAARSVTADERPYAPRDKEGADPENRQSVKRGYHKGDKKRVSDAENTQPYQHKAEGYPHKDEVCAEIFYPGAEKSALESEETGERSGREL